MSRVRSYLDRYAYRLTGDGGTVDDLYVTLDEARRILRAEPDDDIEHQLGLHLALDPEPSPPPTDVEPLATLAHRFDLDAHASALLLLAAAPLLNVDISRLYTFAWADFGVKLPTVGFLGEIYGHGPDASDTTLDAFAESAPLRRHRLVELHPTGRWGPVRTLLHMGVAVSDTVITWMLSPTRRVPASKLGGTVHEPRIPRDPLVLDRTVADALPAAIDHWLDDRGRATRLLLVGPRHAGRRSALLQQLAPHDRPLLEFDLERMLAEDGDIDERLRILERNARLEGAVLLLRGDGVFGGRLDARVEWKLGHWLDRCVVPLAVTAAESVPLLYQGEAPVLELKWTRLDLEQRRSSWGRALRRAGLPGESTQRLASAFDVEAGLAHRVAEQAVFGFEPDRPESLVTAVSAILDRRTGHALADVADRVETTLDWPDVVLPPEVLDVLQEVLTQARLRTRVLDEWGFRRTLAYGRGLSCLFSGPPGTGKTMVAAVMARSVGRAMFRVDLSRVVSKWVGETEKNLARVFDEADRAGAILLFDEADSLFAKRTEVKAANDRFANMEVNYLLQRMERFNGMSVLTTNFERSFDEAFKRRLKFRVYFPKPDASMRSEMWRRMIPSDVPRAPDLQFDHLGRSFNFSGGSIKNAVLRAAYYAAEAGEALCQSHLVRAAKTEQREMGHL